MPAPTIKIAEYSILVGETAQNAPVIVVFADDFHAQAPEELSAFVAEIEPNRPIRFQSKPKHDARSGNTVVLKGTPSPIVIQARDHTTVFTNGRSEIERLLAKVSPAINDSGDLLQIVHGHIQATVGRRYPGASVAAENDRIVVMSDTALAQSGASTATASSAPRAPRRVKGKGDQIRVWI